MKWGVVWLGLCFSGCAGTETGNPPFKGTMGYDAYSSVPAMVALRAADSDEAPTQVDSAWLVLGNVSFLGDSECDGSGELGHAKGLGAGDHVGSQAPPTRFELPAPANPRLCGVRLPIAGQSKLPEAAPAELGEHSILITGTRDGVPFRIASAVRADVLLQADGPDFVLDDARAGVLIGFDVAAWLMDVGLKDAEVVDGRLVVDDAHSTQQLAAFEAGIARGIALFRDLDGDGLRDAGSAPIARVRE